MSDESMRVLERAHAKAPDDQLALERLQDERVRRGLGWHGEALPENALMVRERGVYGLPLTQGGYLELVYVPGGEVPCRDFSGPHRLEDGTECPDCNGTGKRKIAPFYLGRFPVTWTEYLAFCGAARHTAPLGEHGHGLAIGNVIAAQWGRPDVHLELRAPEMRFHPATHVSLDDARAFCQWAGLRLPTEQEWKHAALGPSAACSCVLVKDVIKKLGAGNPVVTLAAIASQSLDGLPCPYCAGSKRISRRFPWGNEPPSPERCVWAGHPRFGLDTINVRITPGPLGAREIQDHTRGSTAPVVAERCTVHPICGGRFKEADGCRMALVPARPLGASWCGAHDLCGNVWEMTSGRTGGRYGLMLGGSFRSIDDEPFQGEEGLRKSLTWGGPIGEPSDEVGFRVALSASS
jgi:formylglycine-generating enzyme required for sulfatase activity